MTLVYLLLAVAAGSLVPIQAGINASLRTSLEHPLLAAITNFLVGLTLLVTFAAAARVPLPSAAQISQAPWWCWIGGSMGAALVLSGVLLSHRLGAAVFIACIILGQLSASVLLDHFGLVGFPQHSLTLPRVAGLFLLAAGVYVIRRW
jgi:bacterial/archaeal transporter family-2 protein